MHTYRTGGKKSNKAALQSTGSAHRKPRRPWLSKIKILHRAVRAPYCDKVGKSRVLEMEAGRVIGLVVL
jgi:hypothetical protein